MNEVGADNREREKVVLLIAKSPDGGEAVFFWVHEGKGGLSGLVARLACLALPSFGGDLQPYHLLILS